MFFVWFLVLLILKYLINMLRNFFYYFYKNVSKFVCMYVWNWVNSILRNLFGGGGGVNVFKKWLIIICNF